MVEGWQVAGHDRFAALHAKVVEDRSSERGRTFEEEFRKTQRQKEIDCGGTPQPRKRKAAVLEVASSEINLLGELLAAAMPSPV